MPTVRVLPHPHLCPDGARFESEPGQSLCDALLAHGVPLPFATASRSESRIDAVALIVIEIDTASSGIPSSSVSMSSSDAIGTPTFPTSPRASA